MFKASYRLYDNRLAANTDTDSWTLGYDYKLSKRSLVWITTSHLNNKNGAVNAFFGGLTNATQVGLRHTF
jgi:predicted porin